MTNSDVSSLPRGSGWFNGDGAIQAGDFGSVDFVHAVSPEVVV